MLIGTQPSRVARARTAPGRSPGRWSRRRPSGRNAAWCARESAGAASSSRAVDRAAAPPARRRHDRAQVRELVAGGALGAPGRVGETSARLLRSTPSPELRAHAAASTASRAGQRLGLNPRAPTRHRRDRRPRRRRPATTAVPRHRAAMRTTRPSPQQLARSEPPSGATATWHTASPASTGRAERHERRVARARERLHGARRPRAPRRRRRACGCARATTASASAAHRVAGEPSGPPAKRMPSAPAGRAVPMPSAVPSMSEVYPPSQNRISRRGRGAR